MSVYASVVIRPLSAPLLYLSYLISTGFILVQMCSFEAQPNFSLSQWHFHDRS